MNLIPEAVYKRTDIHKEFGGQQQGGISAPSNSEVILIFSGESGSAFGYEDGWTEDGIFRYTGEGQEGDMEFIRGNSAIRYHQENGKKLGHSHLTMELAGLLGPLLSRSKTMILIES